MNTSTKTNTVYLLCGKVGSGKSTYAKILADKINSTGKGAFILSADALMLRLFDECIGPERHQEFLSRCKGFLYYQAEQLLEMNIDVILDFGFWSKSERTNVIQHFSLFNAECRLVLLNPAYEAITANLEKRNQLVEKGLLRAYHIDMEKRKRFDSFFELPDADENYICSDALLKNS